MELNFNQCLILWFLIFIAGLILCRCLMAVVNRAFLVVDYAKEQLYPGGKGASKSFGVKEFAGSVLQSLAPGIASSIQNFFGVKSK